jgi:hypothetical protein
MRRKRFRKINRPIQFDAAEDAGPPTPDHRFRFASRGNRLSMGGSEPALSNLRQRLDLRKHQLGPRKQFLLTVTIIFVVLCLRRPDALGNAQFWAEDGEVFFRDQLVNGFWQSVGTPYAGYLLFVPRLVAALASLLPAIWAPLCCNFFALALAAICCSLFVLPVYRYLLPSDLERFVVCLLAAAVPYSDEALGSITFIQWYLVIAAILIAFQKYDGGPPKLSLSVPIAIAGLLVACSCPLLIVLLPILFWKLLRCHSMERVWLGAMLAGICLQIAVLLMHQPNQGVKANWNEIINDTVACLVYRVAFCQFLGVRLAGRIFNQNLWSVTFLALIAATLWFSWLYRVYRKQNAGIFWVSLYLLVSSILLTLVGRPEYLSAFGFSATSAWIVGGERYFVTPAWILTFLVAESIRFGWSSARNSVRALLLCAVFFHGAWENFSVPPRDDLHWSAQAWKVDAWRRAWAAGAPVEGVAIKTTPVMPLRPWTLNLPTRLAAARKDSRWEGLLVSTSQSSGGYLIENGRRRPASGETCTFDGGLRLDRDRVLIDAAELQRIPAGGPPLPCVSSAPKQPSGTPTTVSLTPSSGIETHAVFLATYRHPSGFGQLATAQFIMTNGGGKHACWVQYRPESNALWLMNDSQEGQLGPVTPGESRSVQNSQCVLHGIGSSVSGGGTDLALQIALTFKPAFAGERGLFLFTEDAGGHVANWQLYGNWRVPSGR